ncbi:tetratricopeptide repeat protein [Brevundimonas sp. 2R-24]|uniref:Tetratricopeptide repeat protein n=1 Tax=Peiella sedimenti TaxID=3061083 RepID=A0ABT8SK14_9CAUL|nr:tetratricopeptide repeat protein [Caulobacteraceae bacterium XZ-24]
MHTVTVSRRKGVANGLGRAIALMALALMMGLGLALSAQAQSVDRWGLSARDWQVMNSRDVRQRIGFPGAAPRVLAAARQGDAKAMAVISGAYATGDGVPRNPAESMRWAQAAAQQGDAFGHHVLALNYYHATGVPRDLALTRRHLILASDGGRALASSVLADFYIRGEGVTPNPTMAARYARPAAEAGVPGYAYVYGMLNLPGSNALIDFDAARRWLRTACERGDDKGCEASAALEHQTRILEGDTAEGLFVSTWGQGVVGARTDSAFPDMPCVTTIGVARNGNFPSFDIDWTRTRVRRTAQNTLVFEGAVQVGQEVRNRLVIFERDAGGDAIARLDALERLGRLNAMCQRFASGY